MAKTGMIRARIEPSLKESVEEIFKKIGLSTTEAITLFYIQVKLNKGIPFDLKIPNEVTLETIRKSVKKEDLHRVKNVEELFEELES
ncbi:MAG: type II toxin-antitoxin system RelB/DinJ family antitoxin [Melioribacteraceae bacterium]|jgi:DNA-damage-inducible protein J|nr:type II toxin-antitoxin system RelB/DinJ family antitoxin [Melioribacteraceae bacterium]